MTTRTSFPAPVLGVIALAAIGILFWTSMTVQAFSAGADNRWVVLSLAIVLGGAHVAALLWTVAHSRKAHYALWFIIVGDSLLTILADWRAILLVGFTIVMLALTRTRAARSWYDVA